MSANLAFSPAFRLISDNDFAQVWENELNGEKALISTRDFEPGETISPFGAGAILSVPNYLTVQVDAHKHILLQPEFLQYINHSCSPNAFFDTTRFAVVCIKKIKQGDEINFFYPSAEWNMEQPFACRCQSANCIKYIQGAAWLSKDAIKHYRFTDFILKQLEQHQQ